MNDVSNRLKGLLGRTSNLNVKIPPLAAFGSEVSLLRLLAQTTIAEVRHNTDHFDVRLGIGPRTLTDEYAERIAPAQVSFYKGLVDDCRSPAGLALQPRVALVEIS